MIRLLTKLFIPHPDDAKNPDTRSRYGILCGSVGIFFNILLFLGKFLAGTISHSIAITADAFNNLSDAASSIVTLIGFRLAGQEPDSDHPFGHGRIEYLSGFIVSAAILVMAVELIRDSIDKIIHPQDTQFSILAVAILIASILVKFYMYSYNIAISKRINSAAMKATATDSLSDSCATLVVLAATIIGHVTPLHIDGWCGVLVGLFILYAGIEAAKDTIDPLLGQSADPEFVKQIEELVLSHDAVIGIHDLIVHDYGPGRVMITLHAEVSADSDILVMHDIIDNIEVELQTKLKCAATIHMDPVEIRNQTVLALKDKTAKLIASIDPELHFHDFRVVTGPSHTNLIYDLLVPYHYKLSDADLVKLLKEKTSSEIGKEFFVVVKIDKAY